MTPDMTKLVASAALALALVGFGGGTALAQATNGAQNGGAGSAAMPSTPAPNPKNPLPAEPNMKQASPNQMDQKGMAGNGPSTIAAPKATPAEGAASSGNQVAMMDNLPSDAQSMSKYYQKDVYDPHDNPIGDTNDFLLDRQGHIKAAIIGVGGFLGVGEKNVAVPFSALSMKQQGGESHLVLDTTKTALEKAPAYQFDQNTNRWVPAKKGNAS